MNSNASNCDSKIVFYYDDRAKALVNNSQVVDIYSNSWGPSGYAHLEGPIALEKAAITNGTANGRGGKGNIYVWAGGNGNEKEKEGDLIKDNSNYDGYANSRYVMAIAASNNYGKHSSSSEKGANILVNAPSNGGSLEITTNDRTGSDGYDSGDYTSTFSPFSIRDYLLNAPSQSEYYLERYEANPGKNR
jgi:kexin